MKGGFLGASPTATSGVFSVLESQQMLKDGLWPRGPSPASGLTATAGLQQLSLTWTAPTNTYGQLTDYAISYTPTGGLESVALTGSTATSYSLTGLQGAVSHSVRVAGKNFTVGEWSSEASATPTSGGPDSLGTLRLWLDASNSGSLTTESSRVTQWNNLQPYTDSYVSAPDESSRPLLVDVSGKPFVRMDSGGAKLAAASPSAWRFANYTGAVIVAVIRPNYTGATTTGAFFSTGSSGFGRHVQIRHITSTQLILEVFGADPGLPSYSTTYVITMASGNGYLSPTDNLYCLAFKYSPAASAASRCFFWKNGILSAAVNSASGGRVDLDPPNAFTIGIPGGGSARADFGEVLVYEGDVSDEDIVTLSGSLMSKWGISG